MMASTITDHLASASGPVTGSGSALNQLGASYYYPNESSGYPVGGTGAGHHQSRYDQGHLSRRQQQQLLHHSAGYTGAPSGLASTSAGAYHLDRSADGGLFDQSRYYPSSGAAMHQSLGNLPSANQRLDRYGIDGLASATGGHFQDRYGPDGGRSGSMPPMSLLDGPAPGLGNYNPLDDSLGGMAGQQPGRGPLLDGVQFGPMAYGAGSGGALGGQQAGNSRDMYVTELRARLQEAQNSYAAVKRELETATQKLGSSMHSIKSFWSPELKKERALRKEEATKYALISDQMKLMRVEVQVSPLVSVW